MGMRIGGLATGMDTDNMIKNMMKPYNMRVDKMKQKAQRVQWQQEAYRNVMSGVSDISKKYFDVLNGENYLLSSKNFSSLKPSGIPDTSNLKINAGSTAVAGSYSIKVNKLSEKAKVEGEGKFTSSDILSKKMSDMLSNEVDFTINGVPIKYDFRGTGKDEDKTVSEIIKDISDKGKVDITYSEITKGFIMRSREEGEKGTITISETTPGVLNTLFGSNIKVTGVNTGKTPDTFEKLELNGTNAEIELSTPNGIATMQQNSNNFTIDGVNYDISGVKKGETINFSLAGNSDEAFNKIKGFIEDYNKLVDELQKKVTEKKYRKYEPLTEEQKKDMKENDIKLWEGKAQSGILRSDSNVQNMLSTMRRAFFDSVEGAGISLKEIGLTTSKDYKEGGKIIFDQSLDKNGNNGEARLKKLLKEDPDKVFKIFSQESTSYPSYSPDLTAKERETRSKEEGIFQRINDIFKDYTRTTRSASGQRGILVEKAGIKGTVSEIDNMLYKDLEKREKIINEMEVKLAERENKYYIQFAQLEKYVNNANSQAGWLAQQLGGGRG